MSRSEFSHCVDVLDRTFAWAVLRAGQRLPPSSPGQHFFCTDAVLHYEPFFCDWGPLNLAMVAKYIRFVRAKLALPNTTVVHVTGQDIQKQTNAAFVFGAYLIVERQFTAAEVHQLLSSTAIPFLAYRDAGYGPNTFGLSLLDCWRGLDAAMQLGFFDLQSFDVEKYEFHEKVCNGDFNWIVPGRLLAFAGPHAAESEPGEYPRLTPEFYIPYFREFGIRAIVRLNKKMYDRRRFLRAGFQHHDLFYVDGSVPPDDILSQFLDIYETEPGPIAIHCKAGLGRTGSLICAVLMKHYQMTAGEAIAWTRISRPGSVIGPQQHYLMEQQAYLWEEGRRFRREQEEKAQGTADATATSTSAVSPVASVRSRSASPAAVAVSAGALRTSPRLSAVSSPAARTTRSSDNTTAAPVRITAHFSTSRSGTKATTAAGKGGGTSSGSAAHRVRAHASHSRHATTGETDVSHLVSSLDPISGARPHTPVEHLRSSAMPVPIQPNKAARLNTRTSLSPPPVDTPTTSSTSTTTTAPSTRNTRTTSRTPSPHTSPSTSRQPPISRYFMRNREGSPTTTTTASTTASTTTSRSSPASPATPTTAVLSPVRHSPSSPSSRAR